jgi:hypothetical protein
VNSKCRVGCSGKPNVAKGFSRRAADLADTSGSNCLPVRFTATDKAYGAVTPLNTGALMTLVGRAGRAGESTN